MSDRGSVVPGTAMHLGVIVSMISIIFCLPVSGSRLIRGIANAVGLTYSRGAILIAIVIICGIWGIRWVYPRARARWTVAFRSK